MVSAHSVFRGLCIQEKGPKTPRITSNAALTIATLQAIHLRYLTGPYCKCVLEVVCEKCGAVSTGAGRVNNSAPEITENAFLLRWLVRRRLVFNR